MEEVKQLSSAMSGFLVPLRMGDGFLSEKFDRVCDAMKALELEWGHKQAIPKAAAMIFIDAQSAMISCSYLYPDQTSEIQEKADILSDLMRRCCE